MSNSRRIRFDDEAVIDLSNGEDNERPNLLFDVDQNEEEDTQPRFISTTM